jgi:rhodanese-related sulfurtransferase
MGLFSFLGIGNSRLRSALENGAVVIDVRTPNEFDQGKVPDSINIPVDRINANVERIRAMKRPVILVCSSGNRSGTALRVLKERGVKDVYNGGSWEHLVKILRKL